MNGNMDFGANNVVLSLSRYAIILPPLTQAKKLNIDWITMLEALGTEPTESLAEARAAQILYEMLGMVCHPEYFLDPPRDQTVD